ncbi:mycothione reductase [Nocardioides albus]|uniref:Mycothione reductase n=1 Tax=Nocardioides albus TaxID=1841 RepID=A0A7W5A168_9ACTN|nr:mycothione reductase [Nocardioides albus]MBB3087630.1 mycothione reductase [Nocardioides albus]GGU10376.1 mycothione reductase [Nocardioides albus]
MRHVDLVVIGSGSGNAIVDERFDDREVVYVEKGVGSRGSYGGTCLNVGCIPTKMLVHTADVAGSPEEGSRLGVDLSLNDADWPRIRDRVFGRIDPIADGGQKYRQTGRSNTSLLIGTARFTGPKQLSVIDAQTGDATALSADQIVVAAGSRPAVPDVPGLAESRFHTSDSVMRLEQVPTSMTILGSGFIAVEMAHIFSSLGVKVTVVARSGQLLRQLDRDVARQFTEIAGARWDVRLNRAVRRVEGDGDGARVFLDGPDGEERLEADVLLVATGRVPNSDLIGAEDGGIELTADGRVVVDETQATTVPGVWALGDISSPYQLKHVANREARTVAHNLLHPEDLIRTDHRYVPYAVFTDPRIASVGLTEQEAEANGIAYVTSTQEYAGIAYGWAMEDTTGFAKLLADPSTGALLGAHIIGPEAPTLIQPLIQAMQFGLDARTMARDQYWIHPAMPELIENALLALPLV